MGGRSRNQQHNNPAKMSQSQEQNSNHVTGNKRRRKQEEREKREIKKGKEGKKTQQWLSMFIYSKTWVEEGGTDGGKRLEKTPFY